MELDTQKQVIQIISDTLGVDDVSEISKSSEFIADLNASPDEIKEIISEIEEKLDIELGIIDVEDLLTVSQLLELIDEAFI